MATSSVKLGGLTITNPLYTKPGPANYTPPAPAPIAASGWHAPMLTDQQKASYANTGSYNPVTAANTSNNSVTTSAPAPYVDPYAKWGGIAGYQQAVDDYNTGKTNVYAGFAPRQEQDAAGYSYDVNKFGYDMKAGQAQINEGRTQDELAKIQGTHSIQDMVGRGINSAGVMLSNKNASSSSGAEAIARAYGDIGGREMNNIGNQYAMGEHALDTSQSNFDDQMALAGQALALNKDKIVNGIVNDAGVALDKLNSQAASASLPDRINIESEKARIKQETLAKLQQYDATLNASKAANRPTDVNVNRQKANELYTMGNNPTNPFTYTTQIPAEFQNTGPYSSDLPVFALPTSKKQTQTA